MDKRNIGVSYVNLDPYVASGDETIKVQDRLDLKDKSMNFVIFSHVIEHLYHPITIFKEVYRVLGDGGRFLVSSDNAFMLNTLLNICHLNDFLHEPIQGSAAMTFNFWRGHNRFFSEKDTIDMLRSVGFKIAESNFYEVYYNSFNNDFFRHPAISIPKWRADILTELPAYRNEIIIVAEK
jgi:SAM-dependent methyltransferase